LEKIVETAVNMGVEVINTELSGDPNNQEICNSMWFRSMDELLPLFEKEGIQVEINHTLFRIGKLHGNK
jgi:myo-inositol catabolism protein IolH